MTLDGTIRAPCLLVASPDLADPNFRRTVVLLCQHSGEGSLGFIINKPLEVELGNLLEDEKNLGLLADQPVFMGGPVQVNSGTILYRGAGPQDDSVEIGDGLFMTGSLEKLKSLHGAGDDPSYRFFLGYSGWAGGQLEWEIRHHSWLISSLDAGSLLQVPAEELWERTLTRMGIDVNSLIMPETSAIN